MGGGLRRTRLFISFGIYLAGGLVLGAIGSGRLEAEESHKVRVIEIPFGEELIVRDADGGQKVVLLASVSVPRPNQPQGKRALDYVSRAILGKDVKIEKPTEDQDSRGDRWRVLIDGDLLQEDLVFKGLAWVDDRYSKDERLRELQEEAKTRRVGLWIDRKARSPWDLTAQDMRNSKLLEDARRLKKVNGIGLYRSRR